jgi:magnesium transporter
MNTHTLLLKQYIIGHPIEAANTIAKLEPESLAALFAELPPETLVTIIPLVNPALIFEVFKFLDRETCIRILKSLDLHYTALMIRFMNDHQGEDFLGALPAEKSAAVRRLLNYLENSVGAHMEQQVVTLHEKMILRDAVEAVKVFKGSIQPELYVLSMDRKLVGFINSSDLITKNPDDPVISNLQTNMSTIAPETPVDSMLTHPGWLDHYSLPVVDNAFRFLGIIKLEEIRSILITEDIRKNEPGSAAIEALGELYRIGLSGLLKSATDLQSLSKK